MGQENKYFLISDPQGAGPPTHGYGQRGYLLASKERAFPSPEAGEVGRGQMHLRYLISTV